MSEDDRSSPTDAELIAEIQTVGFACAEHAITLLYLRYQSTVDTLAKLRWNWQLADYGVTWQDIAGDTWGRALWRLRPAQEGEPVDHKPLVLESGDSFGHYLAATMSNVVATLARKGTRHPLEPLRPGEDGELENLVELVPDPVWSNDPGIEWRDLAYYPQLSARIRGSTLRINDGRDADQRSAPEISRLPVHWDGRTPPLVLRMYVPEQMLACVIASSHMPQPSRDCYLLKHEFGYQPREFAPCVRLQPYLISNYINQGKKFIRENLAYLWYVREGRDGELIAARLKIALAAVPAYIRRGHNRVEGPKKGGVQDDS